MGVAVAEFLDHRIGRGSVGIKEQPSPLPRHVGHVFYVQPHRGPLVWAEFNEGQHEWFSIAKAVELVDPIARTGKGRLEVRRVRLHLLGLHLHLPTPIDRVKIVDMGRTRTLSDEVRLLTADGQLALVDYYVQYKVADARKFLFAARDAEETARNAAAVAMRALVGTHTLQQLQQREDGQFGKLLQTRLGSALAGTDIGISVTGAGIQNVGVPSEARQAFDGIAKAHQDAKAAQATAHADVARSKVVTAAQAAALQTAADSYRTSSIAEAQASVARFGQILSQYQAAPQVTRHRLWLDAMHEVLTKNHVVVNTGSGNVIVQFPPRQSEPASSPAPASTTPDASAPASAASVAPVTSGPALSGVGT